MFGSQFKGAVGFMMVVGVVMSLAFWLGLLYGGLRIVRQFFPALFN